jgi:hypothetical protein
MLALATGSATAQEYRISVEPADGRNIAQSMRVLQLSLGAIGKDQPGVSISTGVIATAKEDNGETSSDDSDQTLSCHGDTEQEALWCSEMLAGLIEVMEDPGQWTCDSTETGADCTHIPH